METWQIAAIAIDVVLVLVIVGLEIGVVKKGYDKRKKKEVEV